MVVIDRMKKPELHRIIDALEQIEQRVLILLDEETDEVQEVGDTAMSMLHDVLWELERLTA